MLQSMLTEVAANSGLMSCVLAAAYLLARSSTGATHLAGGE